MSTGKRIRRIIAVLAPCCAAFVLCGCPYLDAWTFRAPANGEHWLRFVQVSDIHVTDEESPARVVTFDSFVAASYRAQEAFAAQVLDATCRAINRVHYGGYFTNAGPIDFVLVIGDLTDNAQYNELRGFIDVMDGRTVLPDSGELDGPLRDVADDINPNLPFRAKGLAKDIPWYSCLGNHDNLGNGNFTIVRSAADPCDWHAPVSPVIGSYLGLTSLDPPQTSLIPAGAQSLAVMLAGAPEPIDPDTLQLEPDLLVPGAIPADDNRQFISKQTFISEHFNTTSYPAGHGFDPTSVITGNAYYSFRPEQDIPVRFVVLDSVGPDALPGYLGAAGAITRSQFEGFLKPEMRDAKAAGEYVIIVTHHPTSDLGKPTTQSTVTPAEFIGYLASQPHVIAHLCGHMHYEELILHDGQYPYPELISASLIDYPQEVRIFDLFYDRDADEFELRSTFISHADQPTTLSREAYRRAQIDAIADPDSTEYIDSITNMDLSGIESLLTEAGFKATAADVAWEKPLPPAHTPSLTLRIPARKF